MKMINHREISPLYEKDGVTGRSISSRDGVEIIYMTLDPGSMLAPHTTPFDAQFFCHRGTAVLLVGGREITATEGTLLECPGDTPHGIRNDTEEEIALLIVKYPKA